MPTDVRSMMWFDQIRAPAPFATRLAIVSDIIFIPMWAPESESSINPPSSAHNKLSLLGYARFHDSTITNTKSKLNSPCKLRYGKRVL